MALFRTANNVYNFLRRTAYVVDSVSASAAVTVDRQPTANSCMQVSISGGTSNTGSVVIAGTLSGSAVTETISYTKERIKNTVAQYDAISSITTTGFDSEATVPNIYVKAIGTDGSPMQIEYSLASNRPIHTSYMQLRGAANWNADVYGTQETDWLQAVVNYEQVWTPRVGDLMQDAHNTIDKWLVRAVRPMRVGYGYRTYYYEVRATRLDT
jgi:hypothetical protein